jgi:superfamily II DNA or RNA helicase
LPTDAMGEQQHGQGGEVVSLLGWFYEQAIGEIDKEKSLTQEQAIGALATHPDFAWPEGLGDIERTATLKRFAREHGLQEQLHRIAVGARNRQVEERDLSEVVSALRKMLVQKPAASVSTTSVESGPHDPHEVSRTERAMMGVPTVLQGLIGGKALPEALTTKESAGQAGLFTMPELSLAEREHRQRRHAYMRARSGAAAAYRSQQPIEESGLLEHQPSIMGKFADFFAGGYASGLLDVPPNTGKTLFGVLAASDCGIGMVPAGDERPIRAIHVLPARVALAQTVGSEGEGRGYAAFAPDVNVTEYHADTKDLSGDVIVITDNSLLNMAKNEPDKLRELVLSSDLLVLDEAQEMLGPQTSAVLREIMKHMVTIAMSGASTYGSDRSVQSVLGIEQVIARMSFREAVEDGIANGVQMYMVATGSTVYKRSKGPRLTEKDLSTLREKSEETDERNKLILTTMHDLAQAGRKGIVRCVSGGGSAHAREIADMAGQLNIWDAELQRLRPMIVKAVGDFQTREKNKEILDDWHAGKIDAITFTNYITSAFDSDLVDYVLDAHPTTSMVEKIQLAGRGARLKDKLTVYIELIDNFIGLRKDLATFFKVFDVVNPEQGKVIAPRTYKPREAAEAEHAGDATPPDPGAVIFDFDQMSETLRASITALSGSIIAERTVASIRFGEVPEGWIQFKREDYPAFSQTDLPNEVIISRIRTVLQASGLQAVNVAGRVYLPPNMPEIMNGEAMVTLPGGKFISRAVLEGWVGNISSNLFTTIKEQLKIVILKGRIQGVGVRTGDLLTVEDAIRMDAYLREHYPLVDELHDVTLDELNESLGGINTSLLARRVRRLDPSGRLYYTRYSLERKPRICISRELKPYVVEALHNGEKVLGAEVLALTGIQRPYMGETRSASRDTITTKAMHRMLMSWGWEPDEADALTRFMLYFEQGPESRPPALDPVLREKLTAVIMTAPDNPARADALRLVTSSDPKRTVLEMVSERKISPAGDPSKGTLLQRIAWSSDRKLVEILTGVVA